jgi:hypothetical protein
LLEYTLCEGSFVQVRFVLKPGLGRTNREAMNLVAGGFDTGDLSANEGVADGRIDIAQIGEAHCHSARGCFFKGP